MSERTAELARTTSETSIRAELRLDGSGEVHVDTGFPFADHMLTLLAFWGGFDLRLTCDGDLDVDAHHSLEDVGLVLGQCFAEALGDKSGIERTALAKVPMDEALTEVVVDISGRPYFVYSENVLPPVIAGEEKDVWREFLKSFAFKAAINLHVRFEYGDNGHHLLESAFKGLGLALGRAAAVTRQGVRSTKGSLD
ncbi:imidazoleglycerol-phosphate dehydratase HisB [Desulfohalovibrio reitneri]|uniref:imidazoleglycerol-phosphate dehydratase HisB n=1 Tax=Desulfohalovibrio reitneri TaxID=1307759 RepID=UPI0004A6D634|nr:imidazoleglycerol-phosphate dehydratase HisB [Desulfohalovibrio reitneri]